MYTATTHFQHGDIGRRTVEYLADAPLRTVTKLWLCRPNLKGPIVTMENAAAGLFDPLTTFDTMRTLLGLMPALEELHLHLATMSLAEVARVLTATASGVDEDGQEAEDGLFGGTGGSLLQDERARARARRCAPDLHVAGLRT